jgi:hypothetical protein
MTSPIRASGRPRLALTIMFASSRRKLAPKMSAPIVESMFNDAHGISGV